MSDLPIDLSIREAVEHDRGFVERLMVDALQPFYGGDHKRHARRIFDTHISGGQDRLGFFSFEQKMFIAVVGSEPIGMVHLVGKRQNTYKISPLIVEKGHRHAMGVGRALLAHAIENHDAYKFFLRNGFIKAGNSPSHYKEGVTESMLYLPLLDLIEDYDGPHVSVVPLAIEHEAEVAELLLATLPQSFHGIITIRRISSSGIGGRQCEVQAHMGSYLALGKGSRSCWCDTQEGLAHKVDAAGRYRSNRVRGDSEGHSFHAHRVWSQTVPAHGAIG